MDPFEGRRSLLQLMTFAVGGTAVAYTALVITSITLSWDDGQQKNNEAWYEEV